MRILITYICSHVRAVQQTNSSAEPDTVSSDAGFENMHGIPALRMRDGVLDTCSHSDAEGNHQPSVIHGFQSANHVSFEVVDAAPWLIPSQGGTFLAPTKLT